jgi:phage shock protein A
VEGLFPRVGRVDALLKLAADAGVEVSTAEQALDDGVPDLAREALDRAEDILADLRERWPGMSAAERSLVGPAAADLRTRMDAAASRLPRRRALSEGTPEADPEQERAPEDPTG